MAITAKPTAFNPNQKSATPESWATGAISHTPDDAPLKPPTERPAPLTPAAAEARAAAEAYAEKMNYKKRRREVEKK